MSIENNNNNNSNTFTSTSCFGFDIQVGRNFRQIATTKKTAKLRGSTITKISFLMNVSVSRKKIIIKN